MCPKKVHAVGFFKSALDKDFTTASASVVKSDFDAQATQLKSRFQLSGRERPRVELVQSHNRGITVLQIMGRC
eukprot:1633940-Pyramimonas_sp.AAC.1